MRPTRPKPVILTRRAFGARFAWIAAAVGLGHSTETNAAARPAPAMESDLRDAALRGLALAQYRGDPVAAAAAEATLDRLTQTDPEGALLARIYQLRDVRPAAFWQEDPAAPAVAYLATLHAAIRACQPVAFGYTDLSGQRTTRTVLPLVLVYPPQGIKLLAWCEERGDFRQFFVRAMQDLMRAPGDFSAQRMMLLQGLLEKESARA